MGSDAGLFTPYRSRMGFQNKPAKEKPPKCAMCSGDINASWVEMHLKDKDGNRAKIHPHCADKSRIFLYGVATFGQNTKMEQGLPNKETGQRPNQVQTGSQGRDETKITED